MVFDILGGGGAGGPTGSNNNSGYAATFYPGTSNPGEAQRVALAVGQELPSVDIQLQPVKLARISGVAMGSDGRPMAGAMVMLMPTMKDAVQFMPGGTSRTGKDGQFTLSGVAPGEYSLQVQSLAAMMTAASDAMTVFTMSRDSSAPATPVQEREFATASVTVAGEDITGMVVTGTRGARATGRIVFDGNAPTDGLTSMRLMASPADDSMPAITSAFGSSQVKDDATFSIDGLIGIRLLRVVNPPKGYFLKRVTADGSDVTDTGLEFKPGENVSGLTIELTNKTTSLTGTVKDGTGTALKDYTVVVFAEDPQKWTLPNNRWMTSARPDQDGHFKVSNLPAGSYYAIAVEYVASGEWADPDWLTRASKNATKVQLDEGGSRVLDLTIQQ